MPRLHPTDDSRTRYDHSNGAVRSFFGSGMVEMPSNQLSGHDEISDAFLESNADLFNLGGINLALTNKKAGSSQITVKYSQYHQGIPVLGAYLNVTIRQSDSQVISAVNRMVYGIPETLNVSRVRTGSADALSLLKEKEGPVGKRMIHNKPVLYIWKDSVVWRIEVDTFFPRQYLEFLIDAEYGRVISVTDRRRYHSNRPARIFWPDPVTSSKNSGLHWGSSDSELDAERREVLLENLDDPKASGYSLQGRWVRIVNREKPATRRTTTRTSFSYPVRDPKFFEVMVYFYLDQLISWVRAMDIPLINEALQRPLEADARGADGEDNSHFVAPVKGPVYLAFGEGGTPDACDPGVITHEFGHALHYFLLGSSLPAGSFEEGFNDFLSCVFRDRYNERGFDRANPFPWDNNSTINWDSSRRCDVDLRFDDAAYKTYNLYKKGTVYATALWDIYLGIGGESDQTDDRIKAANEITALCLDMLITVGDTGPVGDLANGLISADNSRSGGKYETIIRESFRQRGLTLQQQIQP